MNDQLEAFIDSLMYVLMLIRIEGTKGYDWAIDARAQVFLACNLGIITRAERERLLGLCGEARLHSGKPFPSEKNAGPCITWFELHKREQAAAEAKPPVQAAEPEPRPSWLRGGLEALEMVRADMAAAEPFVDESEYLEPCPACEGNGEVGFAPCSLCAGSARVPVDAKPLAQGSTNDRSCAVSPAPTASQRMWLPGLLCPQSTGQGVCVLPAPARRQLRLLCVLVEPQLGASTPRYLPFHTMHRVPPRAMVKGKWSQPRYAGLYLRETHATVPTGAVLERCERHRQANALRAPARTVRTGGVSA